MSWFSDVQIAPPIEVFALSNAYKTDTNADKVNLSVGAYRTDESVPWVLPVVRVVESQMAADSSLNHEYLPVAGLPDFRSAAAKMLLGADSPALTENRVDGIQALGGTGALRIGLDFLKNKLGMNTVYVSNPTWGNHKGIAKSLQYENVKEYRYWDEANRTIDFAGFLADMQAAPEKSVILLHACAHNPTGVDPTAEQWMELSKVIREKKLFPFFDCAYQGFASGSLEIDASAVRFFVAEGFEMFVAQSFSKNFGLYNERVGCLTIIVDNAEKLPAVNSQMQLVVRTTWSNSPNHGSRVVATVLNNPALFSEWEGHVKTMAERIIVMRQQLFEKLRGMGTPGNWDHITSQKGMFSYTGLSSNQCDTMINKYHIYLLRSGRINMCGLTTKNIDYVAKAIDAVVRNVPADPKL